MSSPFTLGPDVHTFTLAATDASARTAIRGATQTGVRTLRVQNVGPDNVFLRAGGSTTDATTSGLLVQAGAVDTFTMPRNVTHLAVVCATGETASLVVDVGEGF